LLFCLLTLGVSASWLFPHPGRILYDNTVRFANLPTSFTYLERSFHPLRYFQFLRPYIFGWCFLAILIESFIYCLIWQPSLVLAGVLCFLPPYLLFSMMEAKYPRYFLPFLIFASFLVGRSSGHRLRNCRSGWPTAAIAAFCLLHVIFITWLPQMREGLVSCVNWIEPGSENYSVHIGIISPQIGDWQLPEIIASIDRRGRASPIRLGVLGVRAYLTDGLAAEASRVPGRFAIMPASVFEVRPERSLPLPMASETFFPSAEICQRLIRESDFLLVGGYNFPGYGLNRRLSALDAELRSAFSSLQGSFRSVQEFSLPDGATVTLYQNLRRESGRRPASSAKSFASLPSETLAETT